MSVADVKLPEPPSNTGQVYAFVQRIKNFGSISKNEISKGISKIAKKRGKIPSSRSQFYENTQIAEDTPYNPTKFQSKSVSKKSRGMLKLQDFGRLTINKLPTNLNKLFEPSDYQTPQPAKENESNSSPNLSKSLSNFNESEGDFMKNKNDKSFKSKFRKGSSPSIGSSSTSNIYGSLASKNSTFYVTDIPDHDSGIFHVEKSTSSPDNSNLNLSNNSTSSVNVSCDPKRRSIASLGAGRPSTAPPPPPSETSQKTRRIGSTSWYAECGLFKNEDIHDEEIAVDDKGEKTVPSSWYTESGLYQTSNNSVAR